MLVRSQVEYINKIKTIQRRRGIMRAYHTMGYRVTIKSKIVTTDAENSKIASAHFMKVLNRETSVDQERINKTSSKKCSDFFACELSYEELMELWKN